jgi:hypothetical protein
MLALLLSTKSATRIVTGIYAALVVIASVTNPSTVFTLGMMEF